MARLFLDLDGVLTDFNRQFQDWFGLSVAVAQYNSDPAVRQRIDHHLSAAPEAFWADMPWMPGAQEAWKVLSTRNPYILSRPHFAAACRPGKKTWVVRNLGPTVPLILAEDKGALGRPGDLLVDDSPENARTWPGTFLLHEIWPATLARLGPFPFVSEYEI